MTTIINQANLKSCPFCKSSFKKLGCHLPKCRMREGKDYSSYLSKKTLDKRKSENKPKKARCPKCQKFFIRLETHLRKNSFCMEISSPNITTTQQTTISTTTTKLTTTQQTTVHPKQGTNKQRSSGDQVHQVDQCIPVVRAGILLPNCEEDWLTADSFFKKKKNVIPRIILAAAIDEKNTILVEGLYRYFAEKHGIKKFPLMNKKKHTPHNHDRALKKAKNLKNRARKDYRRAKRSGLCQSEIQSLARNFFRLVQSHSSLKKRSIRVDKWNRAKQARQRCYKDFWKFTSNLLDDNSTRRVTPTFSDKEAYDFFKTTYQST